MNATRFVGKPWALSASGPDAFDCWGLCVVAARDLFGLDFPAIPAPRFCYPGSDTLAREALEAPQWREVERPEPGALVALLDMRGRLHHVSLCLGGDRLLHTTTALGSRVESFRAVAAQFPKWRIYKWAL